WDKARIVAQRLDTGERKTIVNGGSNVRYIRTGHLVYTVGSTLYALPFDARRLTVTDAAVPVEQNVRRSQTLGQPISAGVSQYALADSGTLVFIPGGASMFAERRRIVSMNRAGGVTALAIEPKLYTSLRVSPDGKRLAFDTDDGSE